MSFIFC